MKPGYLLITAILYFNLLPICFGQKTSHLTIESINASEKALTLNYSLNSKDDSHSAFLVRFYYSEASENSYQEIKKLAGDYGIIDDKTSYSVEIPYSNFESGNEVKIKIQLEKIPYELKSFSWVQGGQFLMGNDQGEEDARPAHPVKLNSFFIGNYETTVRQYKQFCSESGKAFPDEPVEWLDDHPMTFISWYDAKEYTSWLESKYNMSFRLPSESEWEYAARGAVNNSNYVYSGSDNINDVGWYKSNSIGTMHSKVGSLYSNDLGIFDMTGNVWEWCEDWYSSKYYSISPSNNPGGPRVGKVKVGRGGSWFHPNVPVSYRFFMTPTAKTNYVGLRVVCSDEPEFHNPVDELITDPIKIPKSAVSVTKLNSTPLKLDIIQPSVVNPMDTFFVIDNNITIKGTIDNIENTLMLLVNGSETSVDNYGNFESKVKLRYLINEIPVKVISKSNIITEKHILVFRAINSDQIASKTNKLKRKNFALLIGTNNYIDYKDLSNPIYDIKVIDSDLKKYYGFETKQVLNPTLNDFYTSLRELSKRKYSDQDQLLIIIAGHGEFDPLFGDGYLVMSDSRKKDVNKTTFVSHSNLRNIINNIDCQHILVIMDACFSGTFDPLIARRGDEEIYDETNRDEFINRKLKYKTRLYITSGGKEYVPDGRPNAHSPFARSFITAIRSFGGEDNILTFNEIISYIEKTKPEPRYGEFGDNEPGSDFLFISKY